MYAFLDMRCFVGLLLYCWLANQTCYLLLELISVPYVLKNMCVWMMWVKIGGVPFMVGLASRWWVSVKVSECCALALPDLGANIYRDLGICCLMILSATY